jgi:CDP-diacylglycerol---serine O-phosphatidyltransferase
MPLHLKERMIDPSSSERRPRRAAYAIPTLFTAGNIFLGYISILRSFRGAMLATTNAAAAQAHFEFAAKAIGVAVFLDGFDGLIARLTHTTSDFGREMDSLADVISFGIAPAILAFAWGVEFVDPGINAVLREQIQRAGYFLSFLFLLCGAARLARFNIQINPVPKNPGRPGRKYFVGLPIPGAAAMVAAVVYAADSTPIRWWPLSIAWLLLLALLSFLMVSTWRYYSFKGISLAHPRSYQLMIAVGGIIALVWFATQSALQVALVILAAIYVSSGIMIRLGGIVRRHWRHAPSPPPPHPEHQVG